MEPRAAIKNLGWTTGGGGSDIKFFKKFLLWPPCVADADIIFLPCGFYLSIYIFLA